MLREEFLAKIDAAVAPLGFNDRSSLIREAVYQLLRQNGISISPEEKTAPGRSGKGGPGKKTALEPVAKVAEEPAAYRTSRKKA